jgi:hypothetical protein
MERLPILRKVIVRRALRVAPAASQQHLATTRLKRRGAQVRRHDAGELGDNAASRRSDAPEGVSAPPDSPLAEVWRLRSRRNEFAGTQSPVEPFVNRGARGMSSLIRTMHA